MQQSFGEMVYTSGERSGRTDYFADLWLWLSSFGHIELFFLTHKKTKWTKFNKVHRGIHPKDKKRNYSNELFKSWLQILFGVNSDILCIRYFT